MPETRTFTGDIKGLEVGTKFVVVTSNDTRPHRGMAYLDHWEVTRREERRVTAERSSLNIDEQANAPWFNTFTSKDDAPLTRQPSE
jgi:hypothetical protein